MSRLPSPFRARFNTIVVILTTGAFIASLAIFATPASAAASGNLDQCTNGAVGPPIKLERCAGSTISAVGGFKNWVNGNSNGQKSHWREGEFISYRTRISGITAGTHTLRVHYDTVHGGKHALDYVGSFDATETTSATASTFHANNNNPCQDLVNAGQMPAAQCTPVTPVSSLAVSAATLVNCAGSAGTTPAQLPGSFKMFGPTGSLLTGMTYPTQNVQSGSGQCATTIDLSFSVPSAISTSAAIVIAWGGHIASQGDWGVNNSASAISGSPYHMALDLLDGASTGSQDRALSTSAIFFAPSITTTLSASSINVGGSVTDSATLSGASANAGGTVTYTVYSDNTCTTSFASGGTKTVTNGVVPDSNAVTFNQAGTFYWQASYSGDSLNQPAKSVCTSEQLVVGKASPTITTTLSESTGAIGDTVHDSATLSGATATAGGSVTYTVYTDNTCSTSFADGGTKTVTNGVVPDSNGVQFNQAGTFFWQAVYSGDANNNGATSDCTTEQLIIAKNTPNATTAQNLLPNDDATITGATSNAGGTLTFSLFSPSDATCSGVPGFTQTVNVSGNGTYSTTNTTFLASAEGTWRWLITYSGDAGNEGFTIACGTERFTIANS